MVDGVLLLVDAVGGAAAPDPVRAAQGARSLTCPSPSSINKVDRSDARIKEVIDEVYELVIDLDRRRAPDRIPDRVLRNARAGKATTDRDAAIRNELEPETSNRSSPSSVTTSPGPSTTSRIRSKALI